jgi:hypothetical protein
MFKKQIILIWVILVALHIAIALFLPEDGNPSLFIIYLAVIVLSKIGLPVFLNPHSGEGWSTPTLFGWSSGVLVWLIMYFIIALVLYKIITTLKPEK